MATYTPLLRSVNTRNTEQPLVVKFRHGTCELVVSSGQQIDPKTFKNGRVTGERGKPLNDLLNEIIGDLTTAYENLRARMVIPITKDAMRKEYDKVRTTRLAEEARQRFERVSNAHQAVSGFVQVKRVVADLDEQISDMEKALAAKRAEREETIPKVEKTFNDTYYNPDVVSVLAENEERNIDEFREKIKAKLPNSTGTTDERLVTYIQKMLESRKNGLGKATIRGYNSVANLLDRFNPKLTIHEVNRECLYSLEAHMISENITNPSIENYITKVKSILNYYAPDLDLSMSYKRYKFQLPMSDDDVVYLEDSELRDFMAYEKPVKSHASQPNRKYGKDYGRMKDIMVFMCSTGLRYSDVFQDFRPLVKQNAQGEDELHVVPVKTIKKGIKCVIPVTPIVRLILKKHDWKIRQMEDFYFIELLREFCADIPSLQSEVIRGEYCGKKLIRDQRTKKWQYLGSHSGRRTFINYCFQENLSIPKIQGMTGHIETQTLMGYANKTANLGNEVAKIALFNLQ